jgi:hypothetical protein
MDKPTHVDLFSCFTVGWSLFMLTEVRSSQPFFSLNSLRL